MNPKIYEIVERCMNDMVERYGLDVGEGIAEDTLLFGESGLLDSVGLVSLIVAVEQEIENELDASVVLADERAMSQANSPFRTVGALAAYASTLVEEEQ
jgi:acyl carrier protein